MPQAIPAIIGMAVTHAMTGVVGAFVAKGIGMAVSFIASGAMGSKKKEDSVAAIGPADRTHIVRQTDSSRDYVYGRTKKSGVLGYHFTSTDNSFFYMAVMVASHSIEEIETIYLNEEEISVASDLEVDTSYTTNGMIHYKAKAGTTFADHLWVDISLGSADNDANARFVDETDSTFSSTDKFNGIATVFIKLKWNTDLLDSVPNPSFIMKGKNDIIDIRDDSVGYTTNVALCMLDYLKDSLIGPGIIDDELESASVIVAANVCDEDVDLDGGGSEDRYTCNGIVDSSASTTEIIEAFTQSMAGTLVYVNGKFKINAGAYQTPSITITDDDIISELGVARPGKRDKFNAVKGVLITEDSGWVPTDFPNIINTTYATLDGETLYKDISLPFVISEATAQRLAKVDLERNRQDLIVSLAINLKQWDIAAGDTVKVTYEPFGWTDKVFDVLERNFIVVDNGNVPVFATRLSLRETASTVYTWDKEETTVDPAPNTNLPNPFTVAPFTNLLLDSSEDQLVRAKDGQITTRIKLTWSGHSNAFVNSGGRVETQFKKSADSVWSDVGSIIGSSTLNYISGVDDREEYDVRVRARNTIGSVSAWTTSTNHTVIGKSSPPPNITGFSVAKSNNIVLFNWDEVNIIDLRGYEIRYGAAYTSSWTNATPLTILNSGTSESTVAVPPGNWSFFIKAIDTIGTYSLNATVAGPLYIVNLNDILGTYNESDFSSGTLSNFTRHYTGVLLPDSQNIPDEIGFDTFDTFAYNPYALCTYTVPEVDLGSDQTVRVWSDIVSELGPGVSDGRANPKFQIKYRLDGEADVSDTLSTNLISSLGTFYQCILTNNNNIVPQSSTIASAEDWDTFDEFVPSQYNSFYYISDEVDLGQDTVMFITPTVVSKVGPGETGTPDIKLQIDYKTAGGSYSGFTDFAGGSITSRYLKFKLIGTSSTNVAYIDSFTLAGEQWENWTVGEVTARYFQVRIKLDTSLGVAKITNWDWTIDQ